MNVYQAVWLADSTPAPGGGSGQGGGGFSNYTMFIFLGGMILLMWFMSRRSKKQQQQLVDFRSGLALGDRVMTAGGMVGVISDIQGDVLTLMSPGGSESTFVRRAIKSQVPDEEWAAMIEPYPPEEGEYADDDGETPDAGEETNEKDSKA
ncbi:MAG: preprotein translocase subunit YajC [Bifidobacteriaceae bacterium]|nr:preprotein translocase subunit YajC [Bifidobacteriaceae bacterium]